MQLVTSLIRVISTLTDARDTAQRQLDAEQKRKGANKVWSLLRTLSTIVRCALQYILQEVLLRCEVTAGCTYLAHVAVCQVQHALCDDRFCLSLADKFQALLLCICTGCI